jgi:formylglycine-generating enzyme required for sulfatase activity
MNSDAKSETDRYVVKLIFNAQDEGSGYDKAYLRVKDEYGTLYDHWVYSQSDGEQSFSFSMRSGFMGKLMVDYFTIYDRAENAKKYDKETMDTLGFKTTSYVGILTSVVDGNQTITLPDSNGSNSLPLESNNTLTVDLNASVALEMIWVEPGIFMMGQVGVAAPVHEVTLTEGFYLGKFEVTQAQYEAVMTGNADGLSATPSNFGGYPNYPVEQVSYNDVQVFLSRLNNIESANIPAGWAFVLPTEAQWEYACRAGTVTDYSWGNDINASQANYDSNYGRPLNVGQYAPNPWGFFDMHGNIIEWTADWDGTYPTGNPVVDPTGPASGSYRVIRGGSWSYPGTYLRSARRGSLSPSPRNNDLGFRVGFKKQ